MSRSRKALRSLTAFFALAVIIGSCDGSTEPRGPGSITVSSVANSLDNFFQYGIAIDNSTPRLAFVGQTLLFTENGLAHGAHTVSVTDIPAGCTGASSRTVTLQGDDTASVIFTINCPRTTGDLRVNVTTTGIDVDQDGYFLLLNSQIVDLIPINGATTFNFVQPGTYTVGLGDVASNCTASAQQSVTVTVGQLSTVNFTVTCTAVGVLRFETSIAGADRDPDGAVVTVDSDAGSRISFTGATNVRVAAGTHSYALADVQPNCTVTGPTTGTHTVAGGDTVTITLSANCTAIPQGTAGSISTETTVDTLSNPGGNPNQAHDIVSIGSRYTPGFLIVTLRFARPITAFNEQTLTGLVGYFELDTDENTSTGRSPFINGFGGSASQGVDFGLLLHEMDSVSMTLVRLPTPPQPPTLAGRVRARFDADSVVVFFPLNKLNDDGKLTVSTTIGTADRPTDIVPNTGQVLLQPPAGPMVTLRTERDRSTIVTGEKTEYPQAGTWRRKP